MDRLSEAMAEILKTVELPNPRTNMNERIRREETARVLREACVKQARILAQSEPAYIAAQHQAQRDHIVSFYINALVNRLFWHHTLETGETVYDEDCLVPNPFVGAAQWQGAPVGPQPLYESQRMQWNLPIAGSTHPAPRIIWP